MSFTGGRETRSNPAERKTAAPRANETAAGGACARLLIPAVSVVTLIRIKRSIAAD